MNNHHTIPLREEERLAAVRRYDILDTPPDGSFDAITAIATRLFKVPIAIISIVDHDRIWFKSHYGISVAEVGRDPGLCASAILSDAPHILTDASCDARALSNPLVAGELGLRFYAGVPLRTHDGHKLGTLCIIDKEPRQITEEETQTLKDLAGVVMDQLELRMAARAAIAIKENMLSEINHRIGNNLQLVSNFLLLQGIQADEGVAKHFSDTADRIERIGRVHHRLSQTDRSVVVDFGQYLTELCDDIARSLFADDATRTLVVEADSAEFPAELATPLALAVNELITNAAKYAYAPGESGTVTVRFKKNTDTYTLSVSDDGVGLPADFDISTPRGLGTRLLNLLVHQMHGKLDVSTGPNGRGVSSSITFENRLRNTW